MSGSQASDPRPRGTGSTLFVLVPALTFLAGLLLGAALMWAGRPESGDSAPARQPEASATAPTPGTPSPGAEGDVVVPAACLRAADTAEQMLGLVREGAQALGDLDTRRLQALIDELEQLDAQLRSDAGDCRLRRLSPSPPA